MSGKRSIVNTYFCKFYYTGNKDLKNPLERSYIKDQKSKELHIFSNTGSRKWYSLYFILYILNKVFIKCEEVAVSRNTRAQIQLMCTLYQETAGGDALQPRRRKDKHRREMNSSKRVIPFQKRNKGNFQNDGGEKFQQSLRAVRLKTGRLLENSMSSVSKGEKK